jgi:hypothetical protein
VTEAELLFERFYREHNIELVRILERPVEQQEDDLGREVSYPVVHDGQVKPHLSPLPRPTEGANR